MQNLAWTPLNFKIFQKRPNFSRAFIRPNGGHPPSGTVQKQANFSRAARKNFLSSFLRAKKNRVKRPNTPKVGDPPPKKIRAFLDALKRPRGDPPPNFGPVPVYGYRNFFVGHNKCLQVWCVEKKRPFHRGYSVTTAISQCEVSLSRGITHYFHLLIFGARIFKNYVW